MPLPTDDLIIWASSDVNLPNLAGPNKVKPIDDLILKGWDFKQKPAADEFNYVLNNLGMHVSYLEESKTYTFSGDVTGTATSTGSEDVTFNVSVTDNSHNHISANISDATSLNTPNMVVRRDVNGDMAANHIRAEAYFYGDLQGNSSTASALQTARTISISGDGSGSVSFNGTSNISIPLVIADNSHNHISANISDATSSNAAFMIVKRDANGGISIGDLTVNKLSNTSTITFPSSANDPGFIKHIETPADTGKLQFSVSDNNSATDLFEFGNTEGGSFRSTFTITSTGVATGSNGQLHSVSVLTGTISHGGTIPLPSGFSEGQCRWMVSMNNDNPSNTAWDWQENLASDHIHSYCSANGTRVVTCYRTVLNETGTQTHNGTANYIIIGYK